MEGLEVVVVMNNIKLHMIFGKILMMMKSLTNCDFASYMRLFTIVENQSSLKIDV